MLFRSDKVVVSWQGEASELGRRLHWQAQACGLGRAQNILALADGAEWCWRLIEQRWPGAHQLLDFYHASEHLHEMAEAVCGSEQEKSARGWSGACTRCATAKKNHCLKNSAH